MRRYPRSIILVLLCIMNSLPVKAQEKQAIQRLFNRWSKSEVLKFATIGFYATDAQTGEILGSSTPQLSMVPASTLKLLTTSAALEILGADYRFETRLAYDGDIHNDTLQGDLVILGGGDPALGSKYFKDYNPYRNFVSNWATEIRNMGINHITGNLIIDTSIYEDQSIPSTWIWEDMGNYYGAGVFGLSAYDNTYEIHFSSPALPDKPTKLLFTSPKIPGIEFENQVFSSNENRDKAFVYGSPIDNKRVIRGSIPKGKNDFSVKASIPNPPLLIGSQLMQQLGLNQVELVGKVRCAISEKPESLITISILKSPRLAEIIDVTNHESVNLFAEHILKQIAFENTGLGTTEAGIELVTQFWAQHGMEAKGLFLEDGSGLSRFNAITARQMVFILNYMKNESVNSDTFFKSLPTVQNGTLWYFNQHNFQNKALRAKSGSMTRVRCFAGELKSRSQQEILFAIFLNNFSCSQREAIKCVERLLVEIGNQ